MDKGKQVMPTGFGKNLLGFINNEVFETIPGVNSLELFDLANYNLSNLANYELSGLLNYDLSNLANYELSGSLNYELSGSLNFGLSGSVNYGSSGSVNYGLSGSINYRSSGSVNYRSSGFMNLKSSSSMNLEAPSATNLESSGLTNLELPGSTNLELPGSTNLKLPGSTNLELPGSTNLELPELSGSTNSERIGLTNNLTNPESSGFDNNVNVNNNQIIQHKMNKLTLHERDFFNNWNEVQHAVDAYSKQHGFVAINVNKPKKVEDICPHHDGVSVNEQNHLCDSDTIEPAPKYLQFPQEILDKIKSYTIVGRLGAGQQYDLLAEEFPQHQIKKKNLYNAIEQDPEYVVIPRLKVVYPQTQHLLCIYHIGENIKKKAKSKLHGNAVKNFVNDFYRMRNSFTQEQFELKYNHMLEKYEPCRFYLETKLYPCRESWAKYAILKLFIAGTKSIQKVESINSVLKKHVDRGTLLKELVKVIDQELEKEASYNHIRDYYGSNPSSGLPSTHNTIFNAIDSLLVEHLAPIPLSLQ
ncbi:473_t:CDS:2 [Cetraspora pellucida]|uniref:473_t:CDS:1 n=1 Tax=Cetraspora pellucida TaxID=1433469 RepID=A0A9N9IV36_9GLOM|nr:473_t:CDS:2 [Cetraspora pellucida]